MLVRHYISRLAAAGLLVLSGVFLLSSCGGEEKADSSAGKGWEDRIAHYSEQITKDPRHYPSFTALAAAYLEKAGDTGDHAALELAEKNAALSIEIQPSFEAYKMMARIEAYGHRFRKAIEWAGKAAGAAPESKADPETASILVDCYIGLGRMEDAKQALDSAKGENFYYYSVLGGYLKAQGNPTGAELAYERASRIALMQDAGNAQLWAEVMAAALWIDTGEPDKALPHLRKAEDIDPQSKALRVHKAEYLALKGDNREAESIYRSLLEKWNDPDIHRRLFSLLKKEGRADEANRHFEAAETGFKKAIEAGHVYPLGPYAKMLCEAGERLDEARRPSAENLKVKRDSEALATEECVSGKSRPRDFAHD